jgi:hypothetical protein
MSFLTGQVRTPKFAGQVLPDRTESGLIFLTFYLTSMCYHFSYDKVPGHKYGVKNLNWDVFQNFKILKQKNLFFFFLDFFLIFSSIFKRANSPASGKENVRFPDSPDFENLPDFPTGRRALLRSLKDGDVIYGRPFSLSCTWEFFIWKRGRGNKFFIDHTHSQLISSHNVGKKILKSKTIFPKQLVFSVSFLNKFW